MSGTFKVEQGELRIDVVELLQGLSDEGKKEVAKLIGADDRAWRQMAEALTDSHGFYNKEDGYGDWWFARETMLEIRQRLVPLMPEVARLAVAEALRQRDDAVADKDRHSKWAWRMWHAHKSWQHNPTPWPSLPDWAPLDRKALRERDAAPELLALAQEIATSDGRCHVEQWQERARALVARATEEPAEFAGLSLVSPQQEDEAQP